MTRSAALAGYGDLARTLGLDPVRMLAAADLPMASLVDPDLRVPAASVARLLIDSAVRARRPDFGLLLSESRSLANLGPLGLVAREQPTLRGVIDMLAHYIAAHNEALSLRIETAGDVTILRPTIEGGDPDEMVQLIELAVAAMIRMLRRLSTTAFVPESVHFMHRAPADLATHRRLLGLTPQFSQAFDGVVFETRVLDMALPQADPLAAAQLSRHLTDWSRNYREDAVLATREMIVVLLPTGSASINRVANHLGTKRRTLHRRLAEQGTSFTAILESSRRSLAETYLRDGSRSLTEIAGLLGYASLSAFSRWRHNRAAGLGNTAG